MFKDSTYFDFTNKQTKRATREHRRGERVGQVKTRLAKRRSCGDMITIGRKIAVFLVDLHLDLYENSILLRSYGC